MKPQLEHAAPRRGRRRLLWLLLPLSILGAVVGLRRLLEADRLSDFLLRRASAATGLELALDAPAEVGLWPDLHLRLSGLSARAPGDAAALLRAREVDVVLPWSALRAETVQVSRLRLHQPEVDLVALSSWLAARDAGGPPAPIALPELAAALQIENGRIHGGDTTLESIDLMLDRLLPGQASTLRLGARLQRPPPAAPLDFTLRLTATPTTRDGGMRLAALSLELAEAADTPAWLNLAGELVLAPPRLQAGLTGEFPRWPPTWPGLPLPGDAAAAVGVQLSFDGGTDLAGSYTVRLERDGASASSEGHLGDIGVWWRQAPRPWLPPARAVLTAPLLELGGAKLEGVEIRLNEDEDGRDGG